jgi:hypothetical protein
MGAQDVRLFLHHLVEQLLILILLDQQIGR